MIKAEDQVLNVKQPSHTISIALLHDLQPNPLSPFSIKPNQHNDPTRQ